MAVIGNKGIGVIMGYGCRMEPRLEGVRVYPHFHAGRGLVLGPAKTLNWQKLFLLIFTQRKMGHKAERLGFWNFVFRHFFAILWLSHGGGNWSTWRIPPPTLSHWQLSYMFLEGCEGEGYFFDWRIIFPCPDVTPLQCLEVETLCAFYRHCHTFYSLAGQ